MRIPGPDHPISIEPHPGRVVVRHRGEVIAESDRALALKEANYPAVYYIPREDVRMERLAESDHASRCPFKGEARYWSVGPAQDAAWSYERPYPAVAPIAGLIAFWRGRVDAIEAA